MPKVGIIGTRGYPSYYGGFETAVRKIAPHLADHGWNVTVYGRRAGTRPDDPDRDYRVRVVDTPGISSSSLSTLTHGLSSVRRAIADGIDVALVMNVANGFWLPLLQRAGIPTVVNVDGIEWERQKWGRVAKTVFRLGARATAKYASELVADAEAISDRWMKEFGRSSVFIPYGGEHAGSLSIPLGLSHRGYILCVARFVPENSVSEFLQAADSLAKKFRIVIVGSSGYRGPLDLAAAQLARNNEQVDWLGHISDDSLLHALWEHAGVYFHGHSVGGTNPALVQAMACGAPIVARDTIYNREVLGPRASFVDPIPSKIVDALTRAMSVAPEFDSFEQKLRAAERYSWEAVCRDYENVLNSALGRLSQSSSREDSPDDSLRQKDLNS